MEEPAKLALSRRQFVLAFVVPPLLLVVIGGWVWHNLQRAQAGLVPSSGSVTAAETYNGALLVVIMATLGYLAYVAVVLAIWLRDHQNQYPRAWRWWVRLREIGVPRPPSQT